MVWLVQEIISIWKEVVCILNRICLWAVEHGEGLWQPDEQDTVPTLKLESESGSVVSDSLQPRGLSPPGFSVHGILQARILQWVAIPFCRGSSQPRDRTEVSCLSGRFFTIWATREASKKLTSYSVCLSEDTFTRIPFIIIFWKLKYKFMEITSSQWSSIWKLKARNGT